MTFARVIYDVVARDGASRTFRHMGDEAGYAEGRVARFGRAFAAVGIGIGIAGVAIAAEAVRMGTTFQAEMTRIQTQAGASAGAVKQLQGEVLRLAQSHAQQGPNELAMALYHLKSVGLDNVHAMRALRVASDLAAVGGSNLEDTTSALAGAWRSGIKGAQSFGKTAATVNAIIGAGNMRMTDFIASLSSGILPAARTFHVSLSSVGSALALMTDEGIPAEVAATRLRMTLSLIGAPSAKAAGALSTIGLRADDLAKKLMQPGPSGGLVGAIALLKQHLDASGQSAVQQAQTIAHAFGGGRSSSAIETLLNNLGVLEKKQTQINNTTGKYGAAVVAQRKTAEAQFHRLSSIIEAAGVRIGLALLPPVTAFVSFIVNRALPAVGTFGSRVGQVFNAIIPVGAIKRDWQDLMQFLGLAKPKPVHLVTGDLLHLPRPAPLYAGDLLHARPSPMLDLIHPLPKTAGDQLVAPLKAGIIAALSGSGFGMALGHALGTAFGWLGQHSAVFIGGLVNTLAHLDWVSIGKAVGGNALGFAIGFISNLGADLFSPSFWEHHWWDLIVAVLSVGLVGKFIGPVEKIISHVPVLRLFSPFLKGIQKVGTPIFDTVTRRSRASGGRLSRGSGTCSPGRSPG